MDSVMSSRFVRFDKLSFLIEDVNTRKKVHLAVLDIIRGISHFIQP